MATWYKTYQRAICKVKQGLYLKDASEEKGCAKGYGCRYDKPSDLGDV